MSGRVRRPRAGGVRRGEWEHLGLELSVILNRRVLSGALDKSEELLGLLAEPSVCGDPLDALKNRGALSDEVGACVGIHLNADNARTCLGREGSNLRIRGCAQDSRGRRVFLVVARAAPYLGF